MAPSTQGQAWSEILCCPVCNQLFSETRAPISTSCGHVFCRVCALAISGSNCPIDEAENGYPIRELPTNSAILSVVGVQKEASQQIKNLLKKYGKELPSTAISSCEKHLLGLASYMRRANSERGGSVWSELLSRTIQRKLVSVLCAQIVESNCRLKLMRTLRALAERIISEQLLQQQASHSLSTQLWTTVRSRGCQFLGPAMQEDVLKLILLTLSKGALIARKTLVMYIVQTLSEDYPQVSKTCVGHVVQLLYRASCFNVIKREGESSLMQLKEEFRTYEALRREHDTQIVGMAVDAGLRISPDQWSALLYGDQHHRSHMQSIIDKLQSPQSFAQGIEELKTSSRGISDEHKEPFIAALQIFEKISEDDSWERLSVLLEQMNRLIEIHVEIMIQRRELKSTDYSRRSTGSQSTNNNRRMPTNNNHFKTKMCRETASGEVCGRGDSCGFAHSPHELRRDGPPPLIARGMNGPPPSLQNIPMNGFPYQNQQHHLITEMQGMTMNPMLPAAPFVQIPTQPPPMSQQEPPMMSMIMQMGAPGVPIPIDRTIPLGPAIPPPIVLMQPPPLWNGRVPPSQPPPPPGTHLILPQITQQIPWIQQVPMAEYPPNAPTPGLYWSGPSQIQVLSPQPINFVQTIPMMIPPPMDHSFEKTSGDETELLHLKRIEILNRLAPLSSLDEEGEEGDGRGHVSYTVASSVLDDSHRHPSFIGIIPINNGNVSLDLPSVPCNVFSCNTEGDLPNFIPTLRIPPGGSPIMATVQADCSSMTVKDAIRQPITASMITPHVTITSPLPPSANPIQQLPTRIIRPIEIPMIAGGAQHFVSQTLDKIVDVKERLIEVSGPSSSVESEQLRVELLIADRQMEALDPHTQQTCLLIELEEVERKIGELGGNHPPPFTPANVIFKNERCIEPKATTKAITKPHH